jgi:nitrous oxidase accessory protein NosD
VQFTDNIVKECEVGVDIRWGDGLVARNTISGPGHYGIQASFFEGVVEDNEISGFTEAGIISTNENTTLLRNHIHDNHIAGITTSADCIATDNLIENNGWYGLSVAFDAHLTGNVVRGNGFGIEFWGGPHYGFMHENEIYDNVDGAVSAYAGDLDPPIDFDATMNWWGTINPYEIAAVIWDCHDSNLAGVCFLIEPWCITPGCDATGAAEEVFSWGTIKAMYR